MLEVLGYVGAVLIGVSLGLIGAGGSILTVMILVYLFAITPVVATGYSLFAVGVTSFIGSLRYLRQRLVNLRTAAIYGIPSIVSIFITRKFVIPSLPDVLFQIRQFDFTKNMGIMVLFALLMVGASYSMLNRRKISAGSKEIPAWRIAMLPLEGILVGVLTGLVGAGGGFIIIPALILFAGLSMKMAVGTSLLIIAANSLIGFLGDVTEMEHIHWIFLLSFTGLAIVGIIIGHSISKFVPGEKLKPAFGWFILVMGIYIIVKELFVMHLF